MIVSVPASAPIVPPETGASSASMERAARAAASSRASDGGAVDMSMQSEPAASPSARPPGPSVARRTARGRRQHRDRGIRPARSLARARAALDAVDGGLRVEIEAAHLVAGRDEPRRHQTPHAAEPDECDDGHVAAQLTGTNGPAL